MADTRGTENPRVRIAVRVSSDDQRDRGFGWSSQMRRLPELVREQGWQLAQRPDGSDALYDEGAASTTPAEGDELSLDSRPVLQALLGELRQVQPTYLVCRKLDRLHRSSLEWELLQHRLRQAGVEAVVQFPSLDGRPEFLRIENPRDRTLASLQAAFAQMEKDEMREKMRTGREGRIVEGKPNGGHPPYGYRWEAKKAPLVIHEHEATVYEQLIEWAIEGRGSAWIANRLNRESVPTRGARRGWSATTVRKILRSEAQTGMMRPCQWHFVV